MEVIGTLSLCVHVNNQEIISFAQILGATYKPPCLVLPLSLSSQKFSSSVPGTLDLATLGKDDINVLAKSRRVVITQGFRITESFPIAQKVGVESS